MEKEVWKGLKYKNVDFSDKFAISNFGNLMNVKSKKKYKIAIQKDGSRRITVSLGSRESKLTIHMAHAVAENFVLNKNKKIYNIVIHKDMNSSNDHYSNLIWGNRVLLSEMIETEKSPKRFYGEENKQHKLTKEAVYFIRENCIPYDKECGVSIMADLFNVSISTVSRCFNKRKWKRI